MRQIYFSVILVSLFCCTLTAQETSVRHLYEQAVQAQIEAGTFQGWKCSDDVLPNFGVRRAKNQDTCPETTAGYGTPGWNPNSSPETNNVDPSCTVPFDTRTCNGGKIRIPIRNVIFECPNWNGENYLGGNGFARLPDVDIDATFANVNAYFAKANVEFVEVERTRQVNCDMYDFYFNQWGPNEPNNQFNDGKRDEKDLPAYDEDNIINIYWSGGFGGMHDCCSGVLAYLDKPPSDRDYAIFRYAGGVNSSLAHHELSHYFGVYHTFWNIQTDGNEKSGRPHTALNNNDCLTTGDGICDTWPDPNFEFKCPRECRANGKDTHCYKTNGCGFDMDAYRCANGGALQINPAAGTDIDAYTSTVLQSNFTTYNHHECRTTFTPCQYFKLNAVAKSCRSNLCFSQPETYFTSPSQYDKTVNQNEPIPVFTAGRNYTSFDGTMYAVDCFDWFLNEGDRWSEAVETSSSTFDPSPYVSGPGTYTFYLAEANALNDPPCKIAVRLTVRQGNCNDCTSCTDGIQNGNETDVDCGGPDCPACPTCDDGIMNGDETGIDCGGADCPPCAMPTCDDGVQNGNETGIDCGGDCAPCISNCEVPSGLNVTENTGNKATLNWDAVDNATSYTAQLRSLGSSRWQQQNEFGTSLIAMPLKSGTTYEWRVRTNCDGESSDFSPIQTFVAGASEPTCDDGIMNGDETGVDCGGTDCPACPEPTCDDGIQNGDEEGVDCGGSNCAPCEVPTCDDGIMNGDETGVDCGGVDCPACPSICETPTNLFVTNNTGNSATLNWDAIANADSYIVEVRPIGTTRWRSGNPTTNSALARPLSPGTTYEWRVRANCGSDESDWSTIETFTAGSSNRDNEQIEIRNSTIWMADLAAEAYPSPTSDLLYVNSNQLIDRIDLIDIMGRTIRSIQINENTDRTELRVQKLQEGHYFLRIQAGENSTVVRFVKE
ncbi:MAG: fibronectin type III domain-containing protein [Bacteroidota bacterium]